MKIGNFKTIVDAIEEHNNIFIFHHIRPDGDCLGSQFGLGEMIKENYPNKKVYYIGDSKNILNFLEFKHEDENNIPEEAFDNSLGIVVDASSSDRLEKKELILSGKITNMARLDHHPNSADIDYKYNWIDASYVAAAEMVGFLGLNANWKIPQKATEYIYLGIYTDSGRFFYENTSARTFEVVSGLMKNGLNINKIHQFLSKRSIKEAKFTGNVLLNFDSKEKVAWYHVSQELQEQLELNYEEANQVNILNNIEDNRIWIFFIDQPNGEIRVRLRSNGPKVNTIARQYNGGGHDNASGAMIKDKNLIPEIIQKAIALIKEEEQQ